MNSTKLPAFQFYPGDWRKHPGVQSLDYQSRGVWLEILCLMHESDQRGVLLLNGRAMPDEALARLLGLDVILLKQILTTLDNHGVTSRETETGALVSRRMVKDENLRRIRAEAGKQGGNPVLLKQNPTTGDKQNPTPSSSSSTSVVPPKPPKASPSAPLAGVKEGVNSKRVPSTDQSRRIAAIFHRRPDTPWTDKEVRAYKKIGTVPDADLRSIEGYYAAHWPPSRDTNILRHDLVTFLNNFQGEVDRARMDGSNGSKSVPAVDPPGWPEFLLSLPTEYREHATAPDFLKGDFRKWLKKEAAAAQ